VVPTACNRLVQKVALAHTSHNNKVREGTPIADGKAPPKKIPLHEPPCAEFLLVASLAVPRPRESMTATNKLPVLRGDSTSK